MIKLIATCPDETKHILAEELRQLGCQDVVELFRAVSFTATEEQYYRAHLELRTASNLILVIKENVSAKTPIMLQSQARRIHWDKYFANTKTFVVDANQTDRGSEFMSSNDVSKAVRLGIEDCFIGRKMAKPMVDLKEPDVRIVVFSRHERVMFGINTSGKTMHKRGYKLKDHPAPIKETLAASVLKLAGYDGSQVLLDPMCGSGTIAIEAAGIALGKAPLIHRKKDEFGFEALLTFNRELWRDIQQHARDAREEEPKAAIFASDVQSEFVEMAREHALRARVEKFITFDRADFLDLKKPAEKGLLIANLPYGERMKDDSGDDEALKEFFKKIGDHLKKEFSGWTAALLVSESAPYKFVGLKPSRKINVLNGSIPCKLLIYEMFSGERREFVKKIKGDVMPSAPGA